MYSPLGAVWYVTVLMVVMMAALSYICHGTALLVMLEVGMLLLVLPRYAKVVFVLVVAVCVAPCCSGSVVVVFRCLGSGDTPLSCYATLLMVLMVVAVC